MQLSTITRAPYITRHKVCGINPNRQIAPPWLFGVWMNYLKPNTRFQFRKYQLVKPISPNLLGSKPSASAANNLFHDDDMRKQTRIGRFLTIKEIETRARCRRRKYKSRALGEKLLHMRVTASAEYAIDDYGGIDQYILRCLPGDTRSRLANQMKRVMYFYRERPDLKKRVNDLGLSWKTFISYASREDPEYAIYHTMNRQRQESRKLVNTARKYTPYYLPEKTSLLYPNRHSFMEGTDRPEELNLWWQKTPELEKAYRSRLQQMRHIDKRYTDADNPLAYRRGQNKGGGGQPSKLYKPRVKGPNRGVSVRFV